MSAEDIARTIVYSSIVLPCLLFVGIYLWLLPSIKGRVETYHILLFTFVIGYIAADFLMGIALNWWEFSAVRFLAVLGVAAVLLWQRLILLVRYNVIPRAKRRREARQRAVRQVD